MAPAAFLVLFDTRNDWLYSPENPAPKVDVLLHYSDLTQVGGLPSLKKANVDEEDEEDQLEEDSRLCIEYMKGLKADGIHYLKEGTYTFALKSGPIFAFNGYVFGYGSQDRFNGVSVKDLGRSCSTPNGAGYANGAGDFNGASDANEINAPHPIPAGVDIVMTYCPPFLLNNPSYRLDMRASGMQEAGHSDRAGEAKNALLQSYPRRKRRGESNFGEEGAPKETLLVNAAMNE
ncbi:hypothetical protein K458DRAFT_391424 [Lentithecium fluviatile CBS 122367]|uniref:Uncharacterized protein n=1 Tax=Lentithecium fluviatile CBS 122367 TaxID=1168545 RepID=A0A6G1IUJ5_9PLEO|nr:hypothetical protein K458DRAFT_391424 [Lentithecium fluviatile CBS 122367]